MAVADGIGDLGDGRILLIEHREGLLHPEVADIVEHRLPDDLPERCAQAAAAHAHLMREVVERRRANEILGQQSLRLQHAIRREPGCFRDGIAIFILSECLERVAENLDRFRPNDQSPAATFQRAAAQIFERAEEVGTERQAPRDGMLQWPVMKACRTAGSS